MPAVECDYDGRVTVYESTAAASPHLWLNAVMKKHPGLPASEKVSVSIHVPLDQVDMILAQREWLRDNHYQRPDGERYPVLENEPPWWHQ